MEGNIAFEQWRSDYLRSAPFSAARRRAIKEMKKSNPSFYDWARANDDPDSDSYLKKVSLNEMTTMAVSLKEKIRVYIRTLPGRKKANLLTDISEIDATFGQWADIFRPDYDSALIWLVIQKMEEQNAKNFIKL